LATCESKCKGCSNPTKLDKTRSIITTFITSLKVVESNLQFHELLVKRELNKINDGEVELKDVHEKLHSIFRLDFNVLYLKSGRTK
jgi:hypothetical protein